MYRHCCASLTCENIKFEQLQINKNTCIHRCFYLLIFSCLFFACTKIGKRAVFTIFSFHSKFTFSAFRKNISA